MTPHIGYRRWGHTLDYRHVTPVQSHSGDCGHRIPGTGSGRWLTLEIVTSDPRYIVWELDHPGDCGHVTPGAGYWRRDHPGDWTCDPKCRIWERGHPVDWTYVTRCRLWAGGTPWILSKCDPRHRVWAFPHSSKASPTAQLVKNLPAMQETLVQFLGQEDFLEKEMATHSSILDWRIPWTKEPGRLQSMGSQESDAT